MQLRPDQAPEIKLRADQLTDLGTLMTRMKYGLWNDPGTGKTPVAAVFSKWLWDAKQIRTVWVQPSSIVGKNRDEILKFTDFKPEEVVIVSGQTVQKRHRAMRSSAGKVFLFTADGLCSDWEFLVQHQQNINALIGDEWHLLYSSDTSKRFYQLLLLSKQLKAIVPMTGTLLNGKLSHAFPAVHLLQPLYYGSSAGFMNRHAIFDEYSSVIGWKNHEHLKKVLQDCGVRRSFEEVYGPEAKVMITELCEMHGKQLEAYEQVKAEALLELEDSFIEADTPALNALRCRQVMAHPHHFGLMKSSELTGKEKMVMHHVDLALEAEKPLLVFAVFQPEQERLFDLINKKAPGKVALINGNVSQTSRVEIDKQFRSGKIQFIVGSPDTCAFGFNWGHLDEMVFASRDYSDGSMLQAYRRGIRGVRTTPLRIYILEYRDSIDQRIAEIIESRSKDANLVDPTREIFSAH